MSQDNEGLAGRSDIREWVESRIEAVVRAIETGGGASALDQESSGLLSACPFPVYELLDMGVSAGVAPAFLPIVSDLVADQVFCALVTEAFDRGRDLEARVRSGDPEVAARVHGVVDGLEHLAAMSTRRQILALREVEGILGMVGVLETVREQMIVEVERMVEAQWDLSSHGGRSGDPSAVSGQ